MSKSRQREMIGIVGWFSADVVPEKPAPEPNG
jgi:hypothetical protein